jgi:hypothetical protein
MRNDFGLPVIDYERALETLLRLWIELKARLRNG